MRISPCLRWSAATFSTRRTPTSRAFPGCVGLILAKRSLVARLKGPISNTKRRHWKVAPPQGARLIDKTAPHADGQHARRSARVPGADRRQLDSGAAQSESAKDLGYYDLSPRKSSHPHYSLSHPNTHRHHTAPIH